MNELMIYFCHFENRVSSLPSDVQCEMNNQILLFQDVVYCDFYTKYESENKNK